MGHQLFDVFLAAKARQSPPMIVLVARSFQPAWAGALGLVKVKVCQERQQVSVVFLFPVFLVPNVPRPLNFPFKLCGIGQRIINHLGDTPLGHVPDMLSYALPLRKEIPVNAG